MSQQLGDKFRYEPYLVHIVEESSDVYVENSRRRVYKKHPDCGCTYQLLTSKSGMETLQMHGLQPNEHRCAVIVAFERNQHCAYGHEMCCRYIHDHPWCPYYFESFKDDDKLVRCEYCNCPAYGHVSCYDAFL